MTARIAIVGGGPSGLMLGHLLAGSGHAIDIFEAQAEIGGLCRSRTTDGYTFDLAGGHIMYTKDPRVAALWEQLFVDEPLVVTRRDSRILHQRGLFTSYPFENSLGELPLEHNLECTEGVIRAHLARAGTPEPSNFEDWVRWKMGAGVGRHFMEPYNRKIWKADLRQMSTDWIAGRVPDAPLEDVLRASLGHTTEGYTHQSTFRYPLRGGFAAIHERIAAPIRERIHCNRRVEHIERAGREGWKVDGVPYDHVVSTVPLHVLPELMPGLERDAAEAARGLRFRGVASYLFGIEQEWVKPYCWVYLPHEWQGPANRITYLSNYSPKNAPDGKGSILAEVTYAPGSAPDVSDAGRRALARALGDAGLLDAARVRAWDAELNPVAYILYDLGFAPRRATVLAQLDALPGFHALGRFGRYEYHNSDQCLSQALDLAVRLLPALARGGGAGGADLKVALVIPTLNGGELFGRALDLWQAQQDVGKLDLVCPDSGSRDGTVDRLRAAGARIQTIARGTFNHGETRNRAVAATNAEFVILSVQDAVPVSTAVARELVAPLLKDPALAATYGRQQPRAGCHPVLVERIGVWAGSSQPVVQQLAGRSWDALAPLERLGLIRYDHVLACMRRSVWERQRFEPASFGEDVRWAARVVRSGGRIAFAPAAVVEHSHERSAFDEARRIYCDHANLRQLVGLVSVGSRKQIPVNTQAARAHYRALVEARTDVDATTRALWLAWGDKLAAYENWAQYLGAGFSRRWWFAPLDHWLRRGI